MMKPVALQCVIGGSCKFWTIKLEFAQAFQLLELHMKYLHTPKVIDERVDDNNANEEEEDFEIAQPVDDIETRAHDEEVIEELQSDFADVTSVRDDRSIEIQKSETRNQDPNPVDTSQFNFSDVTLARNDSGQEEEHPVENHHPCGSCGRSSHSSHRASRRKFCSAWNKFCYSCNKRGHLQNVCKTTFAEHVDEFEAVKEEYTKDLSFGEIAGLAYGMSQISKEVQRRTTLKVPHMLYEELKWITAHPPPPPYIKLQVRVDTKAFQHHNFKPPSPYRHRSTEMSALADTGCQACCMGREELRKLGLSEKDLLPVEMKLNGANGSSIQILGGLFVVISGRDAAGKVWETNQLCYVGVGIEKFMLSKEALVKLGMISRNFPMVGSSHDEHPVVAEITDTPNMPNIEQFDLEPCAPEEDGSCNCPRRQPAPEPPKFVSGLSPQN